MFGVEGEMARIVAVLHDVVEDWEGWTFERLREEEILTCCYQGAGVGHKA